MTDGPLPARRSAADKLNTMARAARLDVVNLEQRAGGRTILQGIGLSILPGECVGLLGPSGSGKSTLLKACCGLTRPKAGEVLLDGQNLHQHRDAWRRRMGYVPQEDIIHLELSVFQALDYAARLRLPPGMGRDERKALVERVIRQVGLQERAQVRIGKLSGGQRKRASVGVELLTRPAVLYLDEPTSGQDPHLEETMMRLFKDLAEEGTTVVVTTHAMASVELLDHVAMVHGGQLVYFGPPVAMKAFFEVDSYEGVYKRLATAQPMLWVERFRRTAQYRDLVVSRLRGRPA
jgi:ABC-type multidrug transport system ATPase subunit